SQRRRRPLFPRGLADEHAPRPTAAGGRTTAGADGGHLAPPPNSRRPDDYEAIAGSSSGASVALPGGRPLLPGTPKLFGPDHQHPLPPGQVLPDIEPVAGKCLPRRLDDAVRLAGAELEAEA